MTAVPSLPAATARPGTRRPADRVVGFFAGAFLLPWTVWLSQAADARGIISWHVPGGVALWTLLPVTVTAVALGEGRRGLAELCRRMARWRVPVRWWLAAVAVPLAFAVAAAAIGALFSGWHVGQTMPLAGALAYLGYGTGLFLLTEEAAWRGVALPRLMARRSPLAAALVLGVVWALWHAPMFLVPDSGDAALPFAGFAVLTVATSVIVAWLYLGTRSVLVCAVFHAVVDAAYSYTGVVGEDHAAFWAAVGLEVVVAVVLAARLGSGLGAGRAVEAA